MKQIKNKGGFVLYSKSKLLDYEEIEIKFNGKMETKGKEEFQKEQNADFFIIKKLKLLMRRF